MTEYNAIKNLIGSYGQTVDSVPRQPQKYADHFIEDGSFTDCGVTIQPRSKIKALMQAALEHGKNQPKHSGTRHLQFNTVINITGEGTASSTSQLMVLELGPEVGWRIRNIGLYTDEIVKDTDGKWKFKSRVLTWYKDLGPDALNPDLGNMMGGFFKVIMATD